MNPVQFFTGYVAPFRIKKKVIEKKRELTQEERAFAKEQHEERRRQMLINLEREAKRLVNGHSF